MWALMAGTPIKGRLLIGRKSLIETGNTDEISDKNREQKTNEITKYYQDFIVFLYQSI